MSIRCIAFDLDDTLWAARPVIERAEQQLYAWLMVHYPRITEKYTAAALVENRVAYMGQHLELRYNVTQLRKNWLASLAHAHGYSADNLCETGFEVFWQARNAVTLFEGTREVLEHLAEHFITGVISNGNACVKHIGIGHLFDFVHNAEAAGVAKPHPEIFQQALALAGVAAHEAVYVGDDPLCDIQGAANAGWRTVWFNPEHRPWSGGQAADAVINNLAELKTLIPLLS